MMSLAVNNPDGLKYAKQIYHKKLFQHFKLESHTNNSQKGRNKSHIALRIHRSERRVWKYQRNNQNP